MIRLAILALMLPAAAQAACRQAMAIGLDVSGSVDRLEYRLQLDGVAEALNRPAVKTILFRQPDAPIRITVYEWSGPNEMEIIQPWMALSEAADLEQVTRNLLRHNLQVTQSSTALGAAMLAGFALLDDQPDCWKRTLDLSGDGPNNIGIRPQDIGPERTPTGVVVNGLVVVSGDANIGDTRLVDVKELQSYYRTHVARGPDAFVEVALGYEDYADAMERKLLRELTSLVTGNHSQ